MRAYGNYGGMASSHGTTTDPWNHWAVGSNSGITHSSGVFTVPTAGRYLITYSFYLWIKAFLFPRKVFWTKFRKYKEHH